MIEMNELTVYMLDFSIIFAFSLLGSIFNDYLLTVRGIECKVKICRIFVGAMTASIVVLFGLSNIIMEKFDVKTLLLISFISGLGGFNLLKELTRFKVHKPIVQLLEKMGLLHLEDDEDVERDRDSKNKDEGGDILEE